MKKFLIGIQARSTSERLPNKIGMTLGDKSLLVHCIDAAHSSAVYLNRNSERNGFSVAVALFMPDGDNAVPFFSKNCHVYTGPEEDVLTRYHKNIGNYDYLVRITGDCPLIPDNLISKSIHITKINEYDYFSNVHESVRTFIDGYDCEIISKRALNWLNDNAKTKSDREHVTPFIRRFFNPEFKHGFLLAKRDELFPLNKLSVDTPEDFKAIKEMWESYDKKAKEAVRIFGKNHVHRY